MRTKFQKGSLIFLAVLFTWPGYSHMMPQGKGSINLKDKLAYVVISLPEVLFKNGTELEKKELFKNGISLGDRSGKASWKHIFVSSSRDTHASEHKHLGEIVFIAIAEFRNKPRTLSVENSLWSNTEDSLVLEVTRLDDRGRKQSALATLTVKRPSFEFFLSLKEKTKRWILQYFGAVEETVLVSRL